MTHNATSRPDPMDFRFAHLRDPAFSVALAGKTRRDPALVPGEKTAVFITAGQSLAAGSSQGLYTPTNAAKCDHINIFDGCMYNAVDPLAGHGQAASPSDRACPFTRVADQLISGGQFERVILIPVAYGGTVVAQWDAGGGFVLEPLHKLILVASRRAAALGIARIDGILWQLGETDSAIGTSQASYMASFNSMKAKVAAEIDAPWFVAQSTYIPGTPSNAAVRAAQAALVDGASVFAGPDCDTLGGASRYDDQHWNAAGNAAAAALWYSAIVASLAA